MKTDCQKQQNAELAKFLSKIFQDLQIGPESEQCIDEICKNPAQYKECCQDCLGKRARKTKILIDQLKTNKQFQKFLSKEKTKPIQLMIQLKEQFGKQKNYLYYVKFERATCQLGKIISTLQKFQIQLVSTCFKKSQHLLAFFKNIQLYFLDFIMRRLDVSELILTFNKQAILHTQLNQEIKSTLTELTPTDFIAILSKFYISKPYLGTLLTKVNLSLPLLFSVQNENENIQFYQPQLLENILLAKKYHLIVNIGTQEMVDKGKTKFIQQLYRLKQQYLNLKNSNFHSGAVDFYANIPVKIQHKNLMLADFQGNYQIQHPNYQALLKKSFQLALIVFIHITQSQIPKMNSELFVNNIKFLSINSQAKIILIIRDCKKENQADLFNFTTFWMPKFDAKLSPNIKLIFEKIQKFIGNYKFFAEQIAYHSFLSKQRAIQCQQSQQKNTDIINILRNHNNRNTFYETMFPNLNYQYCMYKYQKDIASLEYQQAKAIKDLDKFITQIEKIKKKIEEHTQKNKKIKSQLIRRVFHELSNKTIFLSNLSDELAKWRNQQTQEIQKLYSEKRAELDKLLMKKQNSFQKQKLINQVTALSQKLETYDVSGDTIFSEAIASTTIVNGQPVNQYAQLIESYYRSSEEDVVPINLIQGKTLTFGNIFLQKFIQKLSELKYKNKNIYVVAVIGAQSSAKSTLLNYLFKCNFATSAGRCTKGVYFTIAQCNGKTIVVIDTQGLISVTARDHTFDVQITSFVMLISDLVIINNKGEVNAHLRDLLGVCIYAIDQLNSTKSTLTSNENNAKKETYQANKVIFALRDQTDDGTSKQSQMLSDIISSLRKDSQIDYSKYMNFTAQDVFPLQSAFMTQNIGLLKIQQANNCFGKSILALRSIIIDSFKQPKHKSLYQFYQQAQQTWKAIVMCGKDIFNFKSIYQAEIKKKMDGILIKMKINHQKSVREQQQNIIQGFAGKQVENQELIEQRLSIFAAQSQRQFQDNFLRECQKFCQQKQWIKYFFPQIKQMNAVLHKICVDRFKININKQLQSKQKDQFQKQINNLLEKLYTEGKSGENIQKELGDHSKTLQMKIKSSISQIDVKLKNIGRNQISYKIADLVSSYLRQYNFANKTVFKHIKALYEQFQQIRCYIKGNANIKLIQMFMSVKNFAITSKQFASIYKLTKDYVQKTEAKIDQLIENSQIIKLQEIEALQLKIKDEISLLYDQFESNIRQIQQGWTFSSLTINKPSLILSLFISLFPKKIQRFIWNNLKKRKNHQLDLERYNIKKEKISH